MGHEFTFHGKVISGKKRGRGIGFPTANLDVSPEKIMPDSGVFAVSVSRGEKMFGGMMNIGTNPTFNEGEGVKHVEINLFDFDKQIYDETLHVTIHAKLREEIAFGSLDELKAQLHKDKLAAAEILKSN